LKVYMAKPQPPRLRALVAQANVSVEAARAASAQALASRKAAALSLVAEGYSAGDAAAVFCAEPEETIAEWIREATAAGTMPTPTPKPAPQVEQRPIIGMKNGRHVPLSECEAELKPLRQAVDAMRVRTDWAPPAANEPPKE
jgi:hypothetical protein